MPRKLNLLHGLSMFGPLLLLVGCDDAGAGTSPSHTVAAAGKDAPAPVARASQAPSVSKPLSESDRLGLQSAATACRSGDVKAFVDAFIQFAAVQRKYTARVVEYSVKGSGPARVEHVPAEAYDRFPIRMVDYYRKPVRPLRPGDDDEHIKIAVNQSQTNRISVEWTRVHYDGRSEGGDDLGNPFTLDGAAYDSSAPPDGQLLFAPTDTCWELVHDARDDVRSTGP